MPRLLIAIVLLLSAATAAARTLELIERAAELALDQVTFPTAVGGTVNFRDCVDCAISTHRTTDATVFVANGRTLSLADFLDVAAQIRAQAGKEKSTVVTVFLDIASGRVTRVTLLG
jgi:hypothetical protein